MTGIYQSIGWFSTSNLSFFLFLFFFNYFVLFAKLFSQNAHLSKQTKHVISTSIPANIYLFKVNYRSTGEPFSSEM